MAPVPVDMVGTVTREKRESSFANHQSCSVTSIFGVNRHAASLLGKELPPGKTKWLARLRVGVNFNPKPSCY
jgi:hypothetical protein